MRKLACLLALTSALCVGGEARAQFANHSLGLNVGYLDLTGVDSNLHFGVPIGLNASLYIENGFDFVAHLGIMIVGFINQNILALDGPTVGIRYLFMEENIRPYAGVDLSYLHLFGLPSCDPTQQQCPQQTGADNFGVGPNLGVDFFVSDSIAVGAKVRYNLFLSFIPQFQVLHAIGGTVNVNTYF